MKRRPLWPLLPPIALAALGLITLVTISYTKDESTECGVRKFTGLHCPGCGGTRCTYDLLSGNLPDALSHNALLFGGLVLFLLGSGYLILRITILGKPAPRIPDIKPLWLWAAIGSIVLFTIFRNIPAWPFNLLAP